MKHCLAFVILLALVTIVLVPAVVAGSDRPAVHLDTPPTPDLTPWVWLPVVMRPPCSPVGSLCSAHAVHTATLLASGTVLVAGGVDQATTLAWAELYSPATNTWTTTAKMNDRRTHHTATLLPSGKVLVVGGQYDVNPASHDLASAEIYEPATNTWSRTPDLAAAHVYHTATLLKSGQVLVAGGYPGGASVELYDPAGDAWSSLPDMNTDRYSHTATLLAAGKVLVAGGWGSGGAGTTAEVYDPGVKTWTMITKPHRAGHTATLLTSGRVLLVGGGDSMGAATATAEVYDPVSKTFSPAAGMSIARLNHTATLLASGRVLVAGGLGCGGTCATAEVYDPVTNTWATVARMSTERAYHTATLLACGKVLVAGGVAVVIPPFGVHASVEVYDPASNTWTPTTNLTGVCA